MASGFSLQCLAEVAAAAVLLLLLLLLDDDDAAELLLLLLDDIACAGRQALGGTGELFCFLTGYNMWKKLRTRTKKKFTSTRSNMTKEMASYSALYWRSGLLPPSCPDSWS